MIGIGELRKIKTNELKPNQKFIPFPLTETITKPNSVEELDNAMKKMDSQNGTGFFNWVKNEENIGYICTYKRDIFEENFERDPKQVFIAVRWLVESWSVPSIAEFLLKMFYHWKLESKKFGALVNGICNGFQNEKNSEREPKKPHKQFDKKKILDLLHVLLIGESSKSTSKFLLNFTKSYKIVRGFGKENFESNDDKNSERSPVETESKTKSWDRFEILELVKGLSFSLQWDESFLKLLLIDFVQYSPVKKSIKKQLELIQLIKFKFQQESSLPQYFPEISPLSNDPTKKFNAAKVNKIIERDSIKNNEFRFTYRYKVNFFIQLLDTILIEIECLELSLILEDLQIFKNNFLNKKHFARSFDLECSDVHDSFGQNEYPLKGLINSKEKRTHTQDTTYSKPLTLG
ncbi:hypothetical protein HK099_001339 [Clydaea vesicula]|uniref:Uncharacterized protein n=1 Tax=Clydaea vesicula TaxID=447962 RepID=A0AAD5TTW8_9FUNG|nr:hypothetical protein HK099_001339 [Clydaea vesicula]KAJ3381469.1 hypothetical protein HDU92_005314 [Lobulomyces angularis]